MGFLPAEALQHSRDTYYQKGNNALIAAVRPFPPQLKQAMYAAAEKRLIKRGTWDGCAFNAAAIDAKGLDVSSFNQAASAFDVPVAIVERFIQTWDALGGTDERCTGLLKAALLDVGLTEELSVPERVKKIVRGYAYKSLETQFHEELANVDSIADLPGMDNVKADAVQILLNAVPA